jgi:SIR2-like domain
MPPSPTSVLTPAQIVEELLGVVGKKDCIAWVGSGLSLVAYPGWRKLLGALCTACGVADFDPALGAPTADDLINKAQECKAANQAAYKKTLSDIFGRKQIITRRAFYLLLGAPFKAYATTSFDPLLSDAGADLGYREIFYYPLLEPRRIGECVKPIFYMHGHATPKGVASADNLVLARSDFDAAYGVGRTGMVTPFLHSVLLSYPILFLGCGLSEPDIQDLMRRVHQIHLDIMTAYSGFKPQPRFAVLPTIEFDGPGRKRNYGAELAESTRFSELDIKILRYHPADPDQHLEVELILEALADRLSPAKVGPGDATPK